MKLDCYAVVPSTLLHQCTNGIIYLTVLFKCHLFCLWFVQWIQLACLLHCWNVVHLIKIENISVLLMLLHLIFTVVKLIAVIRGSRCCYLIRNSLVNCQHRKTDQRHKLQVQFAVQAWWIVDAICYHMQKIHCIATVPSSVLTAIFSSFSSWLSSERELSW